MRLWCFKDHLVEFDGYEMSECKPPGWNSSMLIGVGIMAVLGYVLPFLAQVKK